ncbi:hypothetical protein H0H92_011433 [Tricholoma furcatifolium]|nr:hypothetical protein H0H92_011433 [Tricholoma furcatifolium]
MDLEKQVQEQLRLSEERKRAEAEVAAQSILRPSGTAGQDWGIQEKMGLGTSGRKDEMYKAIQCTVRDVAIAAGLDWERPWCEIPTVDKAKFYIVAREKVPFLKRFHNDWATEEIVKQYFRNKRKHLYRHGWLDVPEKFHYLKETSAKRNPTGSRVKRVRAARVAAAAAQRRKVRERRHEASSSRRTLEEDEQMDEDEEEERDEGEDEDDMMNEDVDD